MALSLYVEPPTSLHRLSPVAKVGGMLCLFTAAFLSDRPLAVAPLAAMVAWLLHFAGAVRNVVRLRVLFIMVFVMTFIVWTLFFRGGTPLVEWGPVAVSATSLRFALGMGMKLVTFLGIGILFLSATKIEEFAYALNRIGVPYKLGFTLTLAFRLVPVFVDAAVTVVQAQRCRGFNFDEGTVLQRIRRYVPVIVPVFMGALRRADGMAMALEARGFQSAHGRSVFDRYPFRAADVLVLGAGFVVAIGYVALWVGGHTTVPLA
jgi:energy-coupling factor transport system permease protein